MYAVARISMPVYVHPLTPPAILAFWYLPMLTPLPSVTPAQPSRQAMPLVARCYQIRYQLKRATLYLGQVQKTFFVPYTRRFPTNELNVILAELYAEVGPAPDLLGIEILAIRLLPAAV